ncbi:MAG: hypothetical protein ACE5GD_07010 [Candidatus Geothermarchaeales archaeon]
MIKISFFLRDKDRLSDEEKILEVIERSPCALSFERIYEQMSSDRYMPRQRLKEMLLTLHKGGEIDREIYTVTFSKTPRIESVIAEIYFKDENQRRVYEEDVLPKLLDEARKTIG